MKALSESGRKTLRYHTGIHGKAEVGVLDLIAVMGPYVRSSTAWKRWGSPEPNEVRWSGPFDNGKPAIYEFIGCFVSKIRRITCKNKISLGTTTMATLATLSGWVADSFHAPKTLATAIAASVLVVVTTAAKGAFCEMSKAQAVKIFSRPEPAKQTKKKKE